MMETLLAAAIYRALTALKRVTASQIFNIEIGNAGMMEYQYIAYDKSGQIFEGVLTADDEHIAERILWEQHLTVAQLRRLHPKRSLTQIFPTFFGVRRQDLIIFSRQFATLLSSGVSLLAALELLITQTSRPALAEVLQKVSQQVREGQSLAGALTAHPYAFPTLYTRTVAVGEHSGSLIEVLQQLCAYLGKQETLARKLRDAMIYPLFVIVVAIFVVVMMFTVALPPIIELFSNFDAELPWPTRVLIGVNTFVVGYGLYIGIALVLLTAGLAWWSTQPGGIRARDALLLRLPLLGRITLLSQITRFTNTTAMLLRAGLPLAEVMELVIGTANNIFIIEALRRTQEALLAGRGLAAPLAREKLFPTLLAQMVRVGEETGALEENLATLTQFYEEEMDRKVQQMVTAVEPALTIVVGVLVGFIAVAMISPMYSVLSQIK